MSHSFVGQELRGQWRDLKVGGWNPQKGLKMGVGQDLSWDCGLEPLQPGLSMQSGIPYNMVLGFRSQESEPARLKLNFFLTQPCTSHSIHWSGQSQGRAQIQGEEEWTSFHGGAEHQSHCEKNMWDGINMLLQPSLERMIPCIWSVYSKASVHGASHTAIYPPRPITQALLAVCCLSVSFWFCGCFWMLQGQQ